MFTFIDLFAGIGGIRQAFESAGGQCVFSSELDKFAQKTYAANFGETPVGDIRNVDADSIPDHDILAGGFPCQPFSISGVSKNNSLGRPSGFDDQIRGTLFFEIKRILAAKHPKAFLLENVKNLSHHDHGNTLKVILATLDSLGYTVYHQILDAKGRVPQHRERTFIVGFLNGKAGNFVFPPPCDDGRRLKDILDPVVPDKYTLSNNLMAFLEKHKAKHAAKGNGFGYKLANLDGFTSTLTARYYKDGAEILVPQEGKNPRRLTPRECARLQGFNESFKIVCSDNQAYKQFGNSVAVPLIAEIAKLVVSQFKELRT